MKKVLIVITKAEIGGAQIITLNLAKGLKEKGIDVILGFGEGDFLKEEAKKFNIPFKCFKTLKRTNNPIKNLLFILEIKKFLEQKKIDVVHFNSSNSLFGAIGTKLAKNKPKTIFTFHGLSVLDPNYKKTPHYFKKLYWLIFKFLLKFIDKAIFVSQSNLEYAKKIGLIKNGEVIYYGLDFKSSDFLSKKIAIKALSEKIGFQIKDRFIVGSVGRLAYQKNYEFLIRVFPEIIKLKKNAICIIIGEGSERSKYESLIKENNLENKIFLVGEIKEAYKYLKAFDLFVLPSRYEGLSISLIETLFAEISALASKINGNEEILGKEFLYPLDNKKQFLSLFKKFDEKLLKQNFKERRFLFSIKNMINRYLKVY